jgi:hypothetical protein
MTNKFQPGLLCVSRRERSFIEYCDLIIDKRFSLTIEIYHSGDKLSATKSAIKIITSNFVQAIIIKPSDEWLFYYTRI